MIRQISRKNYLHALDIVERYHSQIIHGHDLVNLRLLNAAGTCLMSDFLKEHNMPSRVVNTIEEFIMRQLDGGLTLEECTVEFFLEKHFHMVKENAKKYPGVNPKLSLMRGISNKNMNNILNTMYESGFKLHVGRYRELVEKFKARKEAARAENV